MSAPIKNIFTLCLTLLLSTSLIADTESKKLEGSQATPLSQTEPPLEQLQAAYSSSESNNRSHKYYKRNRERKNELRNRSSYRPFFSDGNTIQAPSSLFFQTNIGLGFLYFKKISGNLETTPPTFVDTRFFGSGPFKGKLSYNRTPLYEYILGYRFLSYFKAGLSYLHQGNVTIETQNILNGPIGSIYTLRTNLSLDALLAKAYVESPWPVLWNNLMTNLYFGTAIGPGWLSWTSLSNFRRTNRIFGNDKQLIRQKIASKLVWMLDLGFRTQGAFPTSNFSITLGCKFNLWGNSGQIGKLADQGPYKLGLFKPFRIKQIYQWAPYLGAQWNFPDTPYLSKSARLNDSLIRISTQFTAGVGFLYFKKVRGNLLTNPVDDSIFIDPNLLSTQNVWTSAPISSKLTYNRTPLLEYQVQYRFNECFQLALSYQNQGGVVVQTQPFQSPDTFASNYLQFSSDLNLDAILLKGYLSYNDLTFKDRVNVVPHLAIGFGPGWQSWKRVSTYRMSSLRTNLFFSSDQFLRAKYSANCVLNLDAGVGLRSNDPNYRFFILAGCKYNLWGQARSIGALKDQDPVASGLYKPFSIRSVYQWSPYLGIQWTFPTNHYSKRVYYVDDQDPHTCKPCLVSINALQKSNSFWTQFNAGIGFLYFSGVEGNLATVPDGVIESNFKSAPLSGRLAYNRTPLFEYQFGYRMAPWFKVALSYQHQGNVTVQTPPVVSPAFVGAEAVFDTRNRVQLSSNLVLDALMAKVYFESPRPMLWMNTVTSPYLAVGLGSAWQTWSRALIRNNFHADLTVLDGDYLPLRQKISANVSFMFDLGLRIQSPYPNSGFSITTGLKFNLYGQARALGDVSDSYGPRSGLLKPFKIKSVYQWAPYLGVQWNF